MFFMYQSMIDGDSVLYQNRNTIIIYQKKEYRSISTEMSDALMASSLNVLCEYMYRYYGKKVIILLDEFGMADKKDEVKQWYDGFCFGK